MKEALNGSFIAFGLASLAILLAWIAGVRVSVQVGTGFAPVQLTALAAIVVAGGLTFALSRCASQIVASRREAETEKYLQNLSEASATFTYVLDMDQHKLIHCNNCLCQFVG
ncbi:MAG TPA: hypothetical protein VKT78_15260, partial [Fimbriimonadaceae bacterium]|nr:hypothetical protein [Fimbriimonadaceae bacterium]